MIGRIVYQDISDEELKVLTLAGLLHDIGKMMVPDNIIQKKGRLTLPEYNLVKTHVLFGNNILKGIDNLDPRIAEVAMRHHERCDGTGYPGGYKREQIEPCAQGVSYLDATMGGMGRGAGNCQMELLLGFLKNPQYNLFPIIKFIEENIEPLKAAGVEWGFAIPYLLTGHLNQHPRTAIAAMKAGRKDYTEFYREIIDRDD